MSTDDEDLQLPDSDGEGEGGLRFINFRDQDVGNPIFKVGMLFESVEVLRKAITEYSVKQRVDIWFSRNEQKRLKTQCADGCPWLLYGSVDNRSNGMVIKTYQGTHNCQRKWVVKRCTSRWLAEKYLESFRADKKMSIANFGRVVQKEWNLTPSRSKLQRARRLAMQTVMGDEVEQYKLLWERYCEHLSLDHNDRQTKGDDDTSCIYLFQVPQSIALQF
jgi:hypothetical protein